MYKNLTKFLELLENEGELVRIAAPADPVLEIAEITDRVSKAGGKALLFENTGTAFPVVTNLFGSDRRMALALGAPSLNAIAEKLDGLIHSALSPRGSLAEKMKVVPLLAQAARWFPKTAAGRGECQQVVFQGEDARLSLLPILKCWPCDGLNADGGLAGMSSRTGTKRSGGSHNADGGRFVTLPLVHTVHPETGVRNVGMYRMQVFDDHATGMHWHIHKTGARHWDAYRKAGIARMPVSVCLGGDPAYTYAATAPMPEGLDEYLLAGFLRGKPVRLVKCVTNGLYVPADCDFVIEGWVDTTEAKVTEGPFGDHTGFYSLDDPYPVFHVEAITHRRDAVYPATIVGVPPQEDAYLARATEKIFLAPIRLALQPEIRDLYMPEPGVSHNLAVVSMETSYAGQPEKVASALWGAGQMAFNKYLIAAPADADIRNEDTLAGLLRGVDVSRDLFFGRGILDVLDHATATPGYGGKLLIDATAPEPGCPLKLPAEFMLAAGIDSADVSLAEKWRTIILRSKPDAKPDIAGFIARNKIAGINLIAVFDSATEGLTPYELLWLGTANTDPVRDITIIDGIAVADCRSKISKSADMPARFPNVVTMDPETIALVDRRWDEYGLGERIESPSARYRRLLLSDKADI